LPWSLASRRVRTEERIGWASTLLSSGRIARRWAVTGNDQIKLCLCSAQWIRLRRIGLEGRDTYGLGWFMMGLQMFIMLNRKLYVLITYMVLGPLAPWAPGGRTACPPLRAGPDGRL
jgi:hypothetical protein